MSLFTADHQGFYLNGSLFFPRIQDFSEPLAEWSNTAIVRLPAHLSDDLRWTEQMEIARTLVASGKYILWEIDLGLSTFQCNPADSASFYSFSLALEQFASAVWPSFQEHSFGVCLYRGALELQQNFPLAHWETSFLEWGRSSDYALYSMQLLAEYLHRLVSFLPESLLPFAFFDLQESTSAAKEAQLFSKERFEYLHLALKGAEAPFSGICWQSGCAAQGWLGDQSNEETAPPAPALGLYLPSDAHIEAATLATLDTLITDLKAQGQPFRIVCEDKLTEQWDGLDKLIVVSSALSVQGKRKLLGFIAAGGSVAVLGEPIGLPESIAF